MPAAGSSAFHPCWFNYWQNTKVHSRASASRQGRFGRKDWVFTPDGPPLVPNSDYHRWKALLKAAGAEMFACMTLGIRPPLCS